tara:strand:- start:387 stop:758 length:372 start_codon:yes stop_codon:yes gene_type:complete
LNKNIFGEPLKLCSSSPMTGFYRNGCCDTDKDDYGLHTVCVIVNDEFLNFSKLVGNDLTTPMPHYDFPGLKHGDKWCLCAKRWKQAFENNVAPKVILEATNEKTLEIIDIKYLIKHSHKEIKE